MKWKDIQCFNGHYRLGVANSAKRALEKNGATSSPVFSARPDLSRTYQTKGDEEGSDQEGLAQVNGEPGHPSHIDIAVSSTQFF